MGENDITLNRRQILMTSVAAIAAASITVPAFAADPILIGVPYPHGSTSQASVDLVRNNPINTAKSPTSSSRCRTGRPSSKRRKRPIAASS